MEKIRKNWEDLINEGWTEEEIFDDSFSGKRIVHNKKSKEPYNPIIQKLLFIKAQVFNLMKFNTPIDCVFRAKAATEYDSKRPVIMIQSGHSL